MNDQVSYFHKRSSLEEVGIGSMKIDGNGKISNAFTEKLDIFSYITHTYA